ncbi:MAG: Mth938-like domain-containing protein [Methylophilaceae bacterium]|nr:Mth938-like domain-containing protein [Methylophilaceae bacterium]
MKLHLTTTTDKQLFTGYGFEGDLGWVEVNKKRYARSLIVLPGELITDWQVADFNNLNEASFDFIAKLNTAQFKLEVVLLGTGQAHQFAHPRLSRCLTDVGISVEYMTTDAACRTYNFLMAEGRAVAAALIV